MSCGEIILAVGTPCVFGGKSSEEVTDWVVEAFRPLPLSGKFRNEKRGKFVAWSVELSETQLEKLI